MYAWVRTGQQIIWRVGSPASRANICPSELKQHMTITSIVHVSRADTSHSSYSDTKIRWDLKSGGWRHSSMVRGLGLLSICKAFDLQYNKKEKKF